MEFSIVIPYKENSPKFLEYCIESLENQIYQKFEVLFIHNQSAILEDYLEKSSLNYRIFENTTETTASFRNVGIREAAGNYILFMDADDFLHPNALIYAKRVIDENRDTANVLKLRIAKTDLDKTSALKSEKKPFYRSATLDHLNRMLENTSDVSANERQIVEDLFNYDVIPHDFKSYMADDYFSKLSYHLKAHSFIIKKTFLLENNLFFNTQNDLYADMPFLIRLYNQTEEIKQTTTKLYYKSIHNDPINEPSASQVERPDRQLKKVQAFNESIKESTNDIIIKKVKKAAVNYYLYNVVTKASFKESFKAVLPVYQELQSILQVDSEPIKIKKRHRPEIDSIKSGSFKAAYFLSRSRLFAYSISRFIKPKKTRYRQKSLQKNIFSKLPIKKRTILYESFLGRNYSDSPKALFNYLLQEEPDKWQHVWILNDKELIKDEPEFQGSNVKVIPRFSWRYFYYVSVAKYFVLNMRQPNYLEKHKDQVILSTWHGTPLKHLVFDMDNVTSANKKYKRIFYEQSRKWDYLIADNKYSENIFTSAFMYPRENILTYGYPRNDILVNHTPEDHDRIKQSLGIPLDKKVILYAPTWRDDEFHSVGNYKFTLRLNLERLREELGDEYVIVLRMHYFISDVLDLSEYEGFAFDYSKYNDINDLYIISDLLITDYSSVFFDFANLKRPILFYTYDLAKYKDELRGFYIDVQNDLPGPLLYTSEEVIDRIKNIKSVMYEYEEKYKLFYEQYCSLDDGKASERVVEEVLKS
ncbi:CDP-glycerol:glycerophosphate glycerophosphotransferase [Tetragenococcus koreensis]|uniref:CDP-glycerol glycerophosphotransferase n=1 Tax=Tetragenococcus koreensis TaxID=290335 RepID=A0AAN4RIY1_9ENTE|nr:CDP-glycerol:glycerophosphate glycerophosphotransferase [Tetragenococcus koreensis]AYW45240.1 teichoic acid biosynthesis protein F [Tetragenococcus koreensis]MCF1687013.1 CDP-glycerol:glycerophosphate glycerophosphotransferase [Tetragenococcus koreensis]GEN90336.1 teichoic acid biosynthesis protein F [Tetragenococcus koreensis]GEQ48504.1 CDP-glycerol glycerophosphotransferase [Tetragenococcus koreensis]GEQ51362.1 CDP-glycerol glycerophosphotransferase [Tetragenococcus koreensis]